MVRGKNVGKDGQGKDGAVKDGQGKDGAVKDGQGKDGAVKDGTVKDGAVKDGAVGGATFMPDTEGLPSIAGLTCTDDILWGVVGETCTRSFIRDPTVTDKQKWICLKDTNRKHQAFVDKSETEVKFTIPEATRRDSGLYTIGTSSVEHATELNMKTNITVQIIDKPVPFKPTVKLGKSGGILIEWTPPVTDPVITGYDVECRVVGESRWSKITPYRLSECQYMDDDITSNKTYIYRVIVHNKIGKPWVSKHSDEIPYKIEPPAPRICVPLVMSVNVGDPIELCVEIEDTCDDVTWAKDGRPSNPGSLEDGRSVCTIKKASFEDAGMYTCTAKTGSKYSQQKMKVVVKEKRKDPMLTYGVPCVVMVLFAVMAGLYLDGASLKTEIKLIKQTLKDSSIPISNDPSEKKIALEDFDGPLTSSWESFEKRLKKLETPSEPEKIEKVIPTNTGEVETSKTWMDEFNRALGDLKSLDNKLKEHTTEIENRNRWFKESNKTFESLEVLGDKRKNRETEIENLKTWHDEFDRTFGGLEGLGNTLENYDTEIKNTNTWVKEFNSTFGGLKGLNKTLTNHTTEIKDLKSWVQKINETLQSVTTDIEQIKRNSTNMNAEILKLKPLGEQFKEVKTDLVDLDKLLKDNKDVIDKIRENAANRYNTQIVVAVVFIIEVGLAYWIYLTELKVANQPGDSRATIRVNKVGSNPTTSKTAKQVLEQLPRSVSLDRSICVIGFNNSMLKFHRDMVESALQGLNVPINVVVVSRHEQLLGLPHCQLYVMCTEFTETHVIIEEQGLGLGDLKRCSHDVVQRLRAHMMIVYIHDPGSRSLPQGQLFNKKIHCVNSQKELVRLREKNMFFSIYDKLTDYQSSTFREAVNSCLQRQF